MGSIELTKPHERLINQTIVNYLLYEFKNNYNKIISFQEVSNRSISDIKNIANNFTPSSNLDNHIDTFNKNVNNYIPDLSSPDSPYFEEFKKQLEQYDLIHPNNMMSKSLGITSLDQLNSLTTMPTNFVQLMAPNIMSSSFDTMLKDFPTGEFQLASATAFFDNNVKGSNISGSIENVLNIGGNLVTNFPESIDLQEMDNIFSGMPDMMKNMGLSSNGCVSPTEFLQNITGMATSLINSVNNIIPGMMMMINGIIGQISSVINNIMGAMGCLNPVGLAQGLSGGIMGGISGFAGMNLSGMLTGSLSGSFGASLGVGGSMGGGLSLGIPNIGGSLSASANISLPSINTSMKASVSGKISGMISGAASAGGFGSGGCGICCGAGLSGGGSFNLNTNIATAAGVEAGLDGELSIL